MPPPSAKQLEARLGLNFQHISRKPRVKSRRCPEISQLLQRVEEISARYICYGIQKIRQSEGIGLQTLEILQELGPTLWPDLDETGKRNAPWLFDPSDGTDQNEEHWTTEYPKHLVYSDPIDRAIIKARFREFVDRKVLRRHTNHFRRHSTVSHPPNSDCSCPTDSEESGADEDAGEDGQDTQFNCCSSESGGVQSFDGTPRSGSRSRNMNQHAAPTAPMVSKPSSMGQTKSRLDANNFVSNRATSPRYLKEYRTSMDERMTRGSSRSKPEPTSGSVPDILFDVNPDSPSRNSPETTSWHQDESIRVGARGGSKRGGLKRAGVCSADPEGGAVRKKRTYNRKIPQGAPNQHPGVETSTPAPLASSEWPIGRLESYNSIPSTQECHASSFTLQPHETENTAIPSSRGSHSHPLESYTPAAEASTTKVPATNSSASNIHSAVAEDRGVRGRDEFVPAHSESADSAPVPMSASGRIQPSQGLIDTTSRNDPSSTRHGSRYPPQPSVTDEPDDKVTTLPRHDHQTPTPAVTRDVTPASPPAPAPANEPTSTMVIEPIAAPAPNTATLSGLFNDPRTTIGTAPGTAPMPPPTTIAPNSAPTTAVEQAHVEESPAQVMEKSSPVATSTHDLNDETGHSTVPEANTTPAKVDSPSASTHLTRKIAFTSAEAVESMKGVVIDMEMKRQGQAKTEDMGTIEYLDIVSRGNFFDSMRFELGYDLGEDDTILQAKVKRVSEAPIEGLRTEFTIVQASKKNTSWETLLKGLVEMYKRDRVCVELKLEACLLVGKKTDEKLMK